MSDRETAEDSREFAAPFPAETRRGGPFPERQFPERQFPERQFPERQFPERQFPERQAFVVDGPAPRGAGEIVSFDRFELRALLDLYGRKVADGEWRDYALDFLRDRAVFSVYRRACECALYRIEKTPKLARRQGAYAVVASGGVTLKRGHDLARVLAVLDRRLKLVSG
ncbi:DUF2794 domain-containing protein [Methylocella sp.]|uniref:DUF2794 domain-containing protein n=1 Tax=Methylocella sp. TaxID=1978226 RepID=UPI003784B3B1